MWKHISIECPECHKHSGSHPCEVVEHIPGKKDERPVWLLRCYYCHKAFPHTPAPGMGKILRAREVPKVPKTLPYTINDLRCNIIGTRGADAHIVAPYDTEQLRAWETELRKSSEKFFSGIFLSTIHFDQRLGDWLDELKKGFKMADGDYLDHAYVFLYRAGLTGEKARQFIGAKGPRGGNHGTNWQKISKEIRKRDNNTCQKCGSHEHLQVHHRLWWWDDSPDNLITLCQQCHSKEPTTLPPHSKEIEEEQRIVKSWYEGSECS